MAPTTWQLRRQDKLGHWLYTAGSMTPQKWIWHNYDAPKMNLTQLWHPKNGLDTTMTPQSKLIWPLGGNIALTSSGNSWYFWFSVRCPCIVHWLLGNIQRFVTDTNTKILDMVGFGNVVNIVLSSIPGLLMQRYHMHLCWIFLSFFLPSCFCLRWSFPSYCCCFVRCPAQVFIKMTKISSCHPLALKSSILLQSGKNSN